MNRDMTVSVFVRLGDKITGPLKQVEGAVARAVARIGAKLDLSSGGQATAGMRRVSAGLSEINNRARGAAIGVAAAAGTIAGLAVSFVGPAAQMERFKVQLTNLEGSSAGAEKAMAWISDFATRTPLEMNDTVAAYARLKAFGLDPTNGSLQALVDTMAATGGGAEQLDGLVMALGQSWTKGKLQSEEALQMLERGVPVWDLLAEKLGKTSAEVQELATKGKLGRAEIMLLVEALGDRNKGASEGMSQTWDGIISNLMDHWTRFQVMVMDSGVFDYLKSRLQIFLDLLNRMADDGTLQAWADKVAKTMLTVLQGLWDFGAMVVATWQAISPAINHAVELMGGWQNAITAVAALAFGKALLGITAALFSVGTGLVQVIAGVARLGAVMLANPIGLAVAAIAVSAYLIYTHWGEISAWFARLWASVRQTFDGFAQFVSAVFSGDLAGAVTGIKTSWGGLSGVFSTLLSGLGTNMRFAWETVIKPITDKLGLTEPILRGWTMLRDGLEQSVRAIGAAVDLAWATFIKPAIDGFHNVGGVAGMWNAMKDAIGAVLDWLAEQFATVWSKISPVIDGLRWVKDKGADALGAIGLGGSGTVDMGGAAKESAGAAGTSGLSPERQRAVRTQQDAFRARHHGTSIPHRAQGGTFGPGPVVVGERGTELLYEDRGGFIANHNALRGMVAMAARVRALATGLGATIGTGLLPMAQDFAVAPAAKGGQSFSYSPTYNIALSAPGSGGGDLEALRRMVVAELAAHDRRMEAERRRYLHD